MWKAVIVSILIYLCCVDPFRSSHYGPFDMTLKKMTICKGPKRRNCTSNSAKILNETTMQYDLAVLENITNIHGNIYAISETKQVVKLQMKQLCGHPFWRPFMERSVVFSNCYILKGNYQIVINAQELARKYYGGSFIYGQWEFRSILYNNDCNFNCVIVKLDLTPKHKKS